MNVLAGSRPPWFPLPRAWRLHAFQTSGAVLLETAGGLGDDHHSLLFTAPVQILRANSAPDLLRLFDQLDLLTGQGFHAAGSIDYEAGYALHKITAPAPATALACFGIYAQRFVFDHHTGIASAPPIPSSPDDHVPDPSPILTFPSIALDRQHYAAQFDAVQHLLAAGDTYQVNLTTRVRADLLASPMALYEVLIDAQPVDFAAIVNLDGRLTLSFSPELFFRITPSPHGRSITTRPMKGTAPRGGTPEQDDQQRHWLAHDEKNHAEHVMIVDLLRNDLGRICAPGSVRSDDLFRVEPYPTLFQMTSTVSGELLPTTRLCDTLGALFPSGSVTGAPKRRTMEIIRDLEPVPRGVYTGAIGYLSPVGETTFSVPIRTLEIRESSISMGVGGGIVADSTAAAEYDECRLKASFLNHAATSPQLIETMLWQPATRPALPLLAHHLSRLARSAAQLGFSYDQVAIVAALTAATSHLVAETRVRLLLSHNGSTHIETAPIAGPTSNLRVRIAARRICSTDAWLQHKTTRRAFYDREFARARRDGFDEVLFLNERGELAEGAISTLTIEVDGQLYTPPLASGALPGVLRGTLLQAPAPCVERVLTLGDLTGASAAWLNNALRGSRSIGSLEIE